MPRKGKQGMMWQRVLSPDIGEIDPEHERELRLVAQARAGAAWALSALVARYQPPVVRYLVRLTGSAERGRALAEDVLVRMAKRVRGPHGGEHLRLWLLRTSTEVGLDALRHPQHAEPRRLGEAVGPVALIAGRVGDTPVGRWVAGWGTRMRPQAEPRPAVRTQQFIWQQSAETPALEGEEHDQLTPREALKYRMVRAVLAELPYGDAQCLSLHLVAGLNQTEVAQALGIAPAVARRRIVQGLQLFGRRYEAALASLGLAADFDTAAEDAGAPERALPSGATSTGAMAPSARGMLDAPGVVDADALTQPLQPLAAAPAAASAPALDLPVVQLASPALPARTSAHADEPAPEMAEAEERALTSAAIMAYLRTAAANARPHQETPAVVEAAPVAAPPEPVVDAAAPSSATERGDVASAGHETDRTPELAEQAETLALVEHDALPVEIDAPTGGDTAGAKESGELPPTAPSLGENASEPADEMAVAAPLREPRRIPVFSPVDELERVPSAPDPAAQAISDDDTEETLPRNAHDAIQAETPVAAPAEATATSITSAAEDDEDHIDHETSALAPLVVTTAIGADEAPVLANAAAPATTTDADGVDADDTDDDSPDGADHYMLVVEPEAEPPSEDPRLRFPRARRTQVLSVDGEAEDPSDAAIWPVS